VLRLFAVYTPSANGPTQYVANDDAVPIALTVTECPVIAFHRNRIHVQGGSK